MYKLFNIGGVVVVVVVLVFILFYFVLVATKIHCEPTQKINGINAQCQMKRAVDKVRKKHMSGREACVWK